MSIPYCLMVVYMYEVNLCLFCYRLLGTAKVPLMDLTRGGPQRKDVNTILFDGSIHV